MYEELIERLREYPDREETVGGYVEIDWQDLLDAADVIESLTARLAALQAENGSKDREIERLNGMLADSFQGHLLGELQRKDEALSRLEAALGGGRDG